MKQSTLSSSLSFSILIYLSPRYKNLNAILSNNQYLSNNEQSAVKEEKISDHLRGAEFYGEIRK